MGGTTNIARDSGVECQGKGLCILNQIGGSRARRYASRLQGGNIAQEIQSQETVLHDVAGSVSIVVVLLSVVFPSWAALDCAQCHSSINESFANTAHANASRRATAESILGSFDGGRNQLFTSVPGVFFRMDRKDGSFYQTGVQKGGAQTERFDLVIGSGRRGQSYLYWKEGLLFQLPVSFHAASGRWINSPGYQDGVVHFGRAIPPQCLDCHASRFELQRVSGRLRYAEDYALGIQCGKCHGDVERHDQIMRPSGLSLCARCHSGLEEDKPPTPDVHGNQVGLLKASRCFQRSSAMSCGTCHDVHRRERSPAVLSARCSTCHNAQSCPQAVAVGDAARTQCVECHMPVQQSKLITVQSYRTHRIAVYKTR